MTAKNWLWREIKIKIRRSNAKENWICGQLQQHHINKLPTSKVTVELDCRQSRSKLESRPHMNVRPSRIVAWKAGSSAAVSRLANGTLRKRRSRKNKILRKKKLIVNFEKHQVVIISPIVKHSAIGAGGCGSIPWSVKALSRGHGSRHPLQAAA